MGLINEVAIVVIKKAVEHITAKDPAFKTFVDNLNEMTIFEAMQLYRDKKKQLYLAQPTSLRITKDEEPGIDWTELSLRITREPIIEVIKSFIHEHGLDEVMSISISDALDSATMIGDDRL